MSFPFRVVFPLHVGPLHARHSLTRATCQHLNRAFVLPPLHGSHPTHHHRFGNLHVHAHGTGHFTHNHPSRNFQRHPSRTPSFSTCYERSTMAILSCVLSRHYPGQIRATVACTASLTMARPSRRPSPRHDESLTSAHVKHNVQRGRMPCSLSSLTNKSWNETRLTIPRESCFAYKTPLGRLPELGHCTRRCTCLLFRWKDITFLYDGVGRFCHC